MLLLTCLVLLLGVPAATAEPGRISHDAALQHAPGPYESDGRTLKRGTDVEVGVCFDEGAYCYVEGAGEAGYVEGRLIEGASGTMDAVERLRWERLRQQSTLPSDAQMIAAWGDSLTAGALVPREDTYPAQAERLFGFARAIDSSGVGGQDSTAIAARMNAVPTLLSLSDNAIPADGAAVVVARSTTPVTNQGPHSLLGRLCGISGSLSAETGDGGKSYAYRFTRSRPGGAVPCPAGSTFSFAAGEALLDRVQWIWAGTNGAAPDHTVVDDIAAMVNAIGHDRYLVGAVLSGAAHSEGRIANAKAINATLADAYGKHFVDLVAALAAGADGSAADATDVAAGITPRSLRIDALHLNARGNAIVAKAWHDATLQLGF